MAKLLKSKEFWGTIIAVILLGYCFKGFSWTDMKTLCARVSYTYIIPVVFLEFAMVISRALRWGTIIEKTKKLSVYRLSTLFAAGQVINIVMPALTGMVGRIWLFSKKTDLKKSYIFSTVVIEVLFDAICTVLLIVILSMAFVFPEEYRSVSYIIAIATVATLILLYLILTLKDRIGNFGRKHIRSRWPGAYITLKKFANSFTQGIELLKSVKYFSRTMFLTMFSWVAHIYIAYFLFKAFGFELPLILAVVIMVINSLALMIPITPGNAGTFELAVMATLTAFHIAKSDAVLFALALHILDLIPIVVMGSLFLRTEHLTLKQIKEEGEKDEIIEENDDGDLPVMEMEKEK
ncbi:MAG: lysylphosphatidylglycerol synthase transmembrane domain-containing protein [Candidatus Zixiibacteriota bacterium]